MKKHNKLTSLALLGVTSGLVVGAQLCAADTTSTSTTATTTTTSTTGTMTEVELLSQLNDKSKTLYQDLSQEGKDLALKLASRKCKGMNDCKGLGACKSATNDCAGKNDCKGKGSGPFHDPNLAVKVAAAKMAEKREGGEKPSSQAAKPNKSPSAKQATPASNSSR